MSMAISRTKYTGDPGIFGDIWGGIKKVAGVGLGVATMLPVVGGAAKVLRSLAFPGDARVNIPGATTLPSFPMGGIMPNVPVGMPGSGSGGPNWVPKVSGACPPGTVQVGSGTGMCRPGLGINLPFAGAPGIGIETPFGRYSLGEQALMAPAMMNGGMNGATEFEMRAGKASGWPGYHWNKSDYFLRSGEFVAAGTRSVRNRRRNPANARATSNSIQRIKGAKRYATSLSSITIRKKC